MSVLPNIFAISVPLIANRMKSHQRNADGFFVKRSCGKADALVRQLSLTQKQSDEGVRLASYLSLIKLRSLRC